MSVMPIYKRISTKITRSQLSNVLTWRGNSHHLNLDVKSPTKEKKDAVNSLYIYIYSTYVKDSYHEVSYTF